MKQTVFLAFLLLATLFCNGQGQTDWKFFFSVKEEAQKKHSGRMKVMDTDSLTNAFFASGRVKTDIDTLARWQIMFEKSIGWTHVVGDEKRQAFPDLSAKPKKDLKVAYANAKSYSGSELFKSFGIVPGRLSNTIIPAFPLIHAREDPYNRAWISYTNGDYLVLRYVHSYPDGNMTSFYDETILYFRKADH